MAHAFDEAPEVAPQNYPEVAPIQHQNTGSYGSHPHTPLKPEESPYQGYTSAEHTAYSGSQHPASPYNNAAVPPQSEKQKKPQGRICGCTILVFVLCAIIALLAVAVIGLAAGTGVEANRANDATERLAQLSSSIAATTVTVTAPPGASTTAFADLDNNCSGDPDTVSGQNYVSFKLLGQQTFTMRCNKDAQGKVLQSLFVADFNSCMDACSAFNFYEPRLFGVNENTTCAAVSFIPLWTVKANASAGGAPGNCYMKPGPVGSVELKDPNIGTECHAAVLSANGT